MNKLEIVKDGDIARLKVTTQVNGSPFTYFTPKTGAPSSLEMQYLLESTSSL